MPFSPLGAAATKKYWIAGIGALGLIGAGLGIGLLGPSSEKNSNSGNDNSFASFPTQTAPTPPRERPLGIASDQDRLYGSEKPATFDKIMDVLAKEAVHQPAAQHFAQEFMKQPTLRKAWDVFKSAPQSPPVQARDVLFTVRNTSEFRHLMAKFSSDPGFRAFLNSVSQNPAMARVLSDQQRMDALKAASNGNVRSVLTASAMRSSLGGGAAGVSAGFQAGLGRNGSFFGDGQKNSTAYSGASTPGGIGDPGVPDIGAASQVGSGDGKQPSANSDQSASGGGGTANSQGLSQPAPVSLLRNLSDAEGKVIANCMQAGQSFYQCCADQECVSKCVADATCFNQSFLAACDQAPSCKSNCNGIGACKSALADYEAKQGQNQAAAAAACGNDTALATVCNACGSALQTSPSMSTEQKQCFQTQYEKLNCGALMAKNSACKNVQADPGSCSIKVDANTCSSIAPDPCVSVCADPKSGPCQQCNANPGKVACANPTSGTCSSWCKGNANDQNCTDIGAKYCQNLVSKECKDWCNNAYASPPCPNKHRHCAYENRGYGGNGGVDAFCKGHSDTTGSNAWDYECPGWLGSNCWYHCSDDGGTGLKYGPGLGCPDEIGY